MCSFSFSPQDWPALQFTLSLPLFTKLRGKAEYDGVKLYQYNLKGVFPVSVGRAHQARCWLVGGSRGRVRQDFLSSDWLKWRVFRFFSASWRISPPAGFLCWDLLHGSLFSGSRTLLLLRWGRNGKLPLLLGEHQVLGFTENGKMVVYMRLLLQSKKVIASQPLKRAMCPPQIFMSRRPLKRSLRSLFRDPLPESPKCLTAFLPKCLLT